MSTVPTARILSNHCHINADGHLRRKERRVDRSAQVVVEKRKAFTRRDDVWIGKSTRRANGTDVARIRAGKCHASIPGIDHGSVGDIVKVYQGLLGPKPRNIGAADRRVVSSQSLSSF